MSLCAQGVHEETAENSRLKRGVTGRVYKTCLDCNTARYARKIEQARVARKAGAELRVAAQLAALTGPVVRLCANDLHEMTTANARVVTKSNGHVYSGCIACAAAKKQRSRQRAKDAAGTARREQVAVAAADAPKFVVTAEPWMKDKACGSVPVDVFFPAKGESARPAKDICQGCSVRGDCLEYAIRTNQQHGIWGGLAWNAREQLIFARRRAS